MRDNENLLSMVGGDGSLFGETLKQKQRLQAALTVRHWLESFPETDTVHPSKISLGQIAKTVLQHLEEGRIFFVVKSADSVNEPIRARRVRVSLPPITHPLINKTAKINAHLVALQVQSDVTAADLGNEQGLEQLRLLYNFDSDIGSQYDIRVRVNDPVTFKDKDIGRFPVIL